MLKSVLFANSVSCLGFGALFALAPTASAAVIGTPPVWVILVLGLGLIANGLHLAWTATRPAPAHAWVLWFALGDALWVAATLALILSGLWIEATVPALLVAAWVGACGVAQWRLAPAPGLAAGAKRA